MARRPGLANKTFVCTIDPRNLYYPLRITAGRGHKGFSSRIKHKYTRLQHQSLPETLFERADRLHITQTLAPSHSIGRIYLIV